MCQKTPPQTNEQNPEVLEMLQGKTKNITSTNIKGDDGEGVMCGPKVTRGLSANCRPGLY